MLTLQKIVIVSGDQDAAHRAARYVVDRDEAPGQYVPASYWTRSEPGLPEGAERAHTMWLGDAQVLGHYGVERGAEVAEADLERVLVGRHAQTGEQLRPAGNRRVDKLDERSRERLERAGYDKRTVKAFANVDMTFSAPKSVSVLWSQSSPEVRAAIEQAMLESANAAVGHMTKTKPVVDWGTKRPPDQRHDVARGFGASSALHVTARRAAADAVPAPQLHVHSVLFGVQRSDGEVVAPASSGMFRKDAALEGGAVGRLVLADRLVAMGFEIEWTTGRKGRFFEVVSVPEALRAAMSPRTDEVEAEKRAYERRTGEEAKGGAVPRLATDTRQPKDHDGTPPELVAETWLALGQEHGFGPIEAALLAQPGRERAPLAARRAVVRELALARLAANGPTVSRGTAAAIVYESGAGRMDYEEAHALLQDMEAAGDLLTLAGEQVTTARIRRAEEDVVRVAEDAAGDDGPGLPAEAVAAGIAEAGERLPGDFTLDDEQRAAVAMLTGPSRWTVLTGRAGTGKGPTLDAVGAAFRTEGWQVIAAAVDGTTAQRLGEQTGGNTYTLEGVRASVEAGVLRIDDRTLILIDEASKVGLEHWGLIAGWIERHKARLVAVGHEGQLGAIELPGMYAEMLVRRDRIPVAELFEIRRHRDPDDRSRIHPWLRDYQVLLDRGEAEAAVALLREHDAIQLLDTRAEAVEAMVEDWDRWRRKYEADESILIVHGSNADVDHVNRLAQARRLQGSTPELTGKGIPAVDRDYLLYIGDAVILREAPYEVPRAPGAPRERRVENGQTGIVVDVDHGRETADVRMRDAGGGERTVRFDLGALRDERETSGTGRVPSLRLAYASHTYPVQGASLLGTGALTGHWSQGKEGTYVADTRAILEHHAYGSREDLGLDGTDEDRFGRYARRIGRTQARSASIRLPLDPTARIAAHGPARSEPVPQRAVRERPVQEAAATVEPEAQRAERPAARVVTRDDVSPVPDPAQELVDVLGPDRADAMGVASHDHDERVRRAPEPWLTARGHELDAVLRTLDRGSARATLRRERDRAAAAELVEAAQRAAAELDAQAAELSGVRNRGERRDLEARAATQRALAARDAERLAGVADAPGTTAPLDAWLSEHGDRVAEWVAVRREQAVRREVEVGNAVERAVVEPPAAVVDRVGRAPAAGAPEQAEWEDLVRATERERVGRTVAARDQVPHRGLDAPQRAALDARVDAFREAHGIETINNAAEVATGVERAAESAVDLGGAGL
ncbi:MobF family relaxase [Conexibacter woesei]|uniref:MobF family relaxase n=1 Tax=Conexibacter woesei TaxID=191495 RepID=UPI00041D21F7|nr:MobF family relaxase [Conexibacter woesei]